MNITQKGSTIELHKIKTAAHRGWTPSCGRCGRGFFPGIYRYDYRFIGKKWGMSNWIYSTCNACLNIALKSLIVDSIMILRQEYNSTLEVPKLE